MLYQYVSALEYDDEEKDIASDFQSSKGFHMHVMLIVEAKGVIPINTINMIKPKSADRMCKTGWLVKIARRHGVHLYINAPKGRMHLSAASRALVESGEYSDNNLPDKYRKAYMSLPETKPGKIADAKSWVSYIYKNRSKEGVECRQIYSRSKAKKRGTSKLVSMSAPPPAFNGNAANDINVTSMFQA